MEVLPTVKCWRLKYKYNLEQETHKKTNDKQNYEILAKKEKGWKGGRQRDRQTT